VTASEYAIEVNDVSKTFRLYHDPIVGPLKTLLFPWRSTDFYRPFKAVRNVTLKVKRGEVVGIVGPNGAGKSTLLKMIAGLLPLETGTISVRGRLTALLALGVGVNPEFTGRQNILFSGLLLGMTREEIDSKVESIIVFAEIGDFIDRPMRTYSSGMRARLLFSISMAVDPEILIVDEALATGDSYFVAKSAQRIRELCGGGATVLFVSHNITQVEELCDRAVLMAEGQIIDEGTPQEIATAYNRWAFSREAKRASLSGQASSALTPASDLPVNVRKVRLLDGEDKPQTGFPTGSSVTVEIDYESSLPDGSEAAVFLGFMRTSDGAWVGEWSSNDYIDADSNQLTQAKFYLQKTGVLRIQLEPLVLLNGQYDFWLMLYNGTERYYEARHIAPFFAARRSHVHDRGPVFAQPARILG
jgi:ABC-type polysaccharide/polyol phosphate transport system ATPase subunit